MPRPSDMCVIQDVYHGTITINSSKHLRLEAGDTEELGRHQKLDAIAALVNSLDNEFERAIFEAVFIGAEKRMMTAGGVVVNKLTKEPGITFIKLMQAKLRETR